MPLVLTLLIAVVLAALASAMAVGTATETLIAGAYRDGMRLFYAADGAADFALGELARSEWVQVLGAGGRSTVLHDRPADAGILEGPSGYQVYAYGRFGDMVGRPSLEVDPYIVVWIADVTGAGVEPASSERVVEILATALGRTGGRRSIALTARLTLSGDEGNVERLSWSQDP